VNGSGELQELEVPVLREEYANLGVWILPEEEQLAMPPSFEVGHVASCPWPQVLEAAMSEEGGPAPTQRWMRKLRRVLEHPDASGEAVLAFVIQLAGWLGGIEDVASAARQAVLAVGLQPGLVAALRRGGGNELPERGLGLDAPSSSFGAQNGSVRRLDLAVAVQACRVIALASKGFPEGAAAFSREDAVQLVGFFNVGQPTVTFSSKLSLLCNIWWRKMTWRRPKPTCWELCGWLVLHSRHIRETLSCSGMVPEQHRSWQRVVRLWVHRQQLLKMRMMTARGRVVRASLLLCWRSERLTRSQAAW